MANMLPIIEVGSSEDVYISSILRPRDLVMWIVKEIKVHGEGHLPKYSALDAAHHREMTSYIKRQPTILTTNISATPGDTF